MEDEREGVAAAGGEGEPRVETAVTPIIQAESVHIPTPAWGALTAEEAEVIEAELVETDELPEADDWSDEGDWAEEEPSPRGSWLGWTAFLLAVATAVVHGVAVAADADKQYETATVFAWVAIGLSIAGVLGGALAAILRRGRGPGIAAIVVAVIANPWLLLQVLTVLQG